MPGAVLALEVDLVQSTGKLVPIETGRCAFTGLLNFYAFWGKKLFGIKKILLEENFRRSFTCFIHLTLIVSIITGHRKGVPQYIFAQPQGIHTLV